MTQHHNGYALYLDVELTCWDTTPPKVMQPEIIELGLVAINLDDLQIAKEQAHLVRPRRWEISEKCRNLTGISEEDVRNARPLDEVLAIIAGHFRPDQATASYAWGGADFTALRRSCDALGIISPFRRCVDLAATVQEMLAEQGQLSLSNAMALFGLKFDGIPHGALPDAKNMALFHASILRKLRGIPEAPPLLDDAETVVTLSPFAEKLSSALRGKHHV